MAGVRQALHRLGTSASGRQVRRRNPPFGDDADEPNTCGRYEQRTPISSDADVETKTSVGKTEGSVGIAGRYRSRPTCC
jgi:hypothetical protein